MRAFLYLKKKVNQMTDNPKNDDDEWEEVVDPLPEAEESSLPLEQIGPSLADAEFREERRKRLWAFPNLGFGVKNPKYDRPATRLLCPAGMEHPQGSKEDKAEKDYLWGPLPPRQPQVRVRVDKEKSQVFCLGDIPILEVTRTGDVVVKGQVINGDIDRMSEVFYDWFELHCGIPVRREPVRLEELSLWKVFVAKLRKRLGYIK